MRSDSRDVKGLGRIVRGWVTSAGLITGGVGFLVAKAGTGAYTIYLLPGYAFRTPPVVEASSFTGSFVATVVTATAGIIQVDTFNSTTGGSADSGFGFTATEDVR